MIAGEYECTIVWPDDTNETRMQTNGYTSSHNFDDNPSCKTLLFAHFSAVLKQIKRERDRERKQHNKTINKKDGKKEKSG